MKTGSFGRIRRALACAAVFAWLPAHAVPVLYTTQAAFLQAVLNPGTDNFDDLSTTSSTPSPTTRTAGSYGYRAAASVSTLYGAGSGTDHWLSTNAASASITFDTFTVGIVAGVGGFFFGSTIAGNFQPNASLTIVATDIGGSTSSTILNATTSTFLGFVSGSAITGLTVFVNQPVTSDSFPTVNNLILAQARPTVVSVPEPGVAALVGVGLAGVWLGRRRRRFTPA